MNSQLTLPGLDNFTGLSASQYLDKLIDLIKRCASMDPDKYRAELIHLSRLRSAGKMSEQQKNVFHCLEGLAEIAAREEPTK